MKNFTYFTLVASSVILISCQDDISLKGDDPINTMDQEVVYLNLELKPIPIERVKPTAKIQEDAAYFVKMHSAEYITEPGSSELGKTIIFSDRGNKQLDFDFSPLASIDGSTDISYYVDQIFNPSTVSPLQSEAAIERAVNTWENVRCSDLTFNRVPNIAVPIGIVAESYGFEAESLIIAEINHCGWMSGTFFDQVAEGGSEFILGVTYTFLFVDVEGNYIDTNNDGKWDVAFREIYYNDNFIWADGGDIDIETIALHEMGHGLSQGHFGKAFVKRKGQIQFAPRAVMNAAYSGLQTGISGTDLGGHCSIWANWPNK